MRMPRMNIQRFMVAVIFLAIFLWSGPILVPEVVRRWRLCDARAAHYEAEARAASLWAAQSAARSNNRAAAQLRSRADSCTRKSRQYRRALLIPWKFWSLGES